VEFRLFRNRRRNRNNGGVRFRVDELVACEGVQVFYKLVESHIVTERLVKHDGSEIKRRTGISEIPDKPLAVFFP